MGEIPPYHVFSDDLRVVWEMATGCGNGSFPYLSLSPFGFNADARSRGL